MKHKYFTTPKFAKLCTYLFLAIMLFSYSDISAQIGPPATITVNTNSSISVVNANPQTVCSGGDVILTVDGILGTDADWVWYTSSCGGTQVGTGATITVNPTTGTSQSTITYYVISEGGVCAPSSCQSVIVTINPTPIITPPADVIYCFDFETSPVSVTATPLGALFDISGGTTIGLPNATGVSGIPIFTTINSTGGPLTATITLTPSGGCPGSAVDYEITVLPEITMNDPADLTACSGTMVPATIFTGGPSGTFYSWINDNPSIGLVGSSTGNIASFEGENTNCPNNNIGVIEVTPQLTVNSLTCSGTAQEMTITIFPTPNGSIAGGEICEGQNAILTFTSTCGTSPFTLGVAAGGFTPVVSYPNVASGASFDVNPAPTTTTTYNLMSITDANGCTNP